MDCARNGRPLHGLRFWSRTTLELHLLPLEHARKGSLGTLTVEEGCVRSHQYNFILLWPADFSTRVNMRVGRLI